MKVGFIAKISSLIGLLSLLMLVSGCCWNGCLKRCRTCDDSGVVHERKVTRVITDEHDDVVTMGDMVEDEYEDEDQE